MNPVIFSVGIIGARGHVGAELIRLLAAHPRLVRDRLDRGGIATYWLPVYQLDKPSTLAVIRGFCDVFEDCSLWNGSGLDWVLMGSRGGLGPVPQERIERLWRDPGLRARMVPLWSMTSSH